MRPFSCMVAPSYPQTPSAYSSPPWSDHLVTHYTHTHTQFHLFGLWGALISPLSSTLKPLRPPMDSGLPSSSLTHPRPVIWEQPRDKIAVNTLIHITSSSAPQMIHAEHYRWRLSIYSASCWMGVKLRSRLDFCKWMFTITRMCWTWFGVRTYRTMSSRSRVWYPWTR